MQVGQTFFFGDTEYAIKNIDYDSYPKFPNGRVDASKFVGEGVDRHIQVGRPKAFDLVEIKEILGESEEDFSNNEEVLVSTAELPIDGESAKAWTKVRNITPEQGDEMLESLADKSTSMNW